MHLYGLVGYREPSGFAHIGVRIGTAGVEGRGMAVREHARKAEGELEVAGYLAVDIGPDIVPVVIEVVDVSLLAEVAEGCEIAGFLAAALHRDVVFLGKAGSEDLVNVIHIVPAVGRVAVRHQIHLFPREIRNVFGFGSYDSGSELVHHLRHIVVVGELRAVHEVREVCVHGSTQRGVVADLGLALGSPLGGDDNHTARTLQAIDRSRGTVLEHRNALYVGRVEVIDIGDRITVNDIGSSVNGTADAERSLVEARLTGFLH